MIEFLAGVIAGIITLGTGLWVSNDPTLDELTAENAKLRVALRYVRATLPVSDARTVIDRALADEAGA